MASEINKCKKPVEIWKTVLGKSVSCNKTHSKKFQEHIFCCVDENTSETCDSLDINKHTEFWSTVTTLSLVN